jgi:alpha-1,3-rhamnosyl/mannosyltransferase
VITQPPVGVNLLWMVHGEVGGSETYTMSHLRALAAYGNVDREVVLFALPGFTARHPDLAQRFPIVEAPVSGTSRAVRVAVEATWLGQRLRERHVNVVHHPGGTLPLRSSLPTVLTVHDLQWVTFPRYFSRTKLSYLRARVGPSIRRADVVLVNSRYVKETVVDYAGVSADVVRVVPPAVDAIPSEVSDPAEVRARYGIPEPYFLYPAITYPHKNHLVLVWALSRLARTDIHLVFTGGVASMETTIETEAHRVGLQGRVHRLGRIPRPDLEALYLDAAGVLFPSAYEGFGMGVVEAMRRGCPVAAADTTALPEVVGDAGLLIPPGDPEAWAGAIERLTDDGGLRAELAAAGRHRAAGFEPADVARTLEEAYRDAASG